MIAVIPGQSGLSIAAAHHNVSGLPTLSRCEFIGWNDIANEENLLRKKVHQYGLGKQQFSTSLQIGDYTVLSVDSPDVPPAELRSAIRWQIKDLIDYHIDDAVLDVFDAPAAGVRSGAS